VIATRLPLSDIAYREHHPRMTLRSHLAPMLAVAVSLVLALPSDGAACCMAPRPEAPIMVTPSGATVAPGGAIVMYLSSDAVAETIVLVREGTSAEVTLSRRELAPGVFALALPSSTAAGLHHVLVTRTPAQHAQGLRSYEVASLTVGGPLPTAALSAPRGHVRLASSPGRRGGTSRRAAFFFDGTPPSGVGLVFSWTEGASARAYVQWVAPPNEPTMVAEGHCGIMPYGAAIPAPGTEVRVAYVDLAGRLGPWASLRVE